MSANEGVLVSLGTEFPGMLSRRSLPAVAAKKRIIAVKDKNIYFSAFYSAFYIDVAQYFQYHAPALATTIDLDTPLTMSQLRFV